MQYQSWITKTACPSSGDQDKNILTTRICGYELSTVLSHYKLPKAAKGCPKEIDSNPLPSSPETFGSQPRKTKVTKSRLQDFTSVVDLCDFKEKTNKKSKKAREANRQREMMLDSISNKELPPSPAREEPLSLSRAPPAAPATTPATPVPAATPATPAPLAARAPSATPAPVPEAPKQAKKEPNQKLSKAEKKRANKREKGEAAAAPKVEEKSAEKEVEKTTVSASAVSAPVAKSDVTQVFCTRPTATCI